MSNRFFPFPLILLFLLPLSILHVQKAGASPLGEHQGIIPHTEELNPASHSFSSRPENPDKHAPQDILPLTGPRNRPFEQSNHRSNGSKANSLRYNPNSFIKLTQLTKNKRGSITPQSRKSQPSKKLRFPLSSYRSRKPITPEEAQENASHQRPSDLTNQTQQGNSLWTRIRNFFTQTLKNKPSNLDIHIHIDPTLLASNHPYTISFSQPPSIPIRNKRFEHHALKRLNNKKKKSFL